jgi:putative CocE/NonD family hydrolase
VGDGVGLGTDIYLPTGAGPWPVVFIRHPYAPNAFWAPIASYFADHGYAAVVQIVRGRDRSGGEPVPFVHDRADAHRTLEWIDEQSWSNGRVALFGDSYYGLTAWIGASTGHRTLRAMATRMTSSDVGRDWMYHDGVFNLGPAAEWAAYTWIDREVRHVAVDWDARPLGELVPSAALDDWRTRPPEDPFWTSGIYGSDRSPAHGLGIPTLHRAAMWDPFRRGQIADWQTASRTSSQPQELVLDATDHYDHPWSPDEPVVDILADFERFLPYVPHYLDGAIAFFDVHLRDRPRRESPPVRFRLANGPWMTAVSWPPPDHKPVELALTSGGSLQAERERTSHRLAWEHDPANLVPSPREFWSPLLDLQDLRSLAERDDVLTFTSDELREPLDLVGAASAELRVTAEGPAVELTAQLVDVFPDGRCLALAEGATLTASRVDLGPLAYRLLPGHRLRLHVASSWFPRYLPFAGPGRDPWTSTDWLPARLQLEVGGTAGSTLRVA